MGSRIRYIRRLKDMNKIEARKFMKSIAVECSDGIDVNMTMLAELCAQHFDQDHLNGPLDDESHWIWDLALRTAEEFKGTKNEL